MLFKVESRAAVSCKMPASVCKTVLSAGVRTSRSSGLMPVINAVLSRGIDGVSVRAAKSACIERISSCDRLSRAAVCSGVFTCAACGVSLIVEAEASGIPPILLTPLLTPL